MLLYYFMVLTITAYGYLYHVKKYNTNTKHNTNYCIVKHCATKSGLFSLGLVSFQFHNIFFSHTKHSSGQTYIVAP